MRPYLRIALLALCLPCISCGARGGARPAGAPGAGPATAGAERRGPSEKSLRLAARLRAKGGLRAATTATRTIYEPAPKEGGPAGGASGDGGTPAGFGGFHARLAALFASWLGVPFRIEVVPFDSFFTVGKVVYDEGGPLPPPGSRSDIFKRYDLIVHSLAPLAWRASLVRVLPFMPNRILTITRKGEELSSLRGLAGKRVLVQARSSYESAIRSLRGELGLDFDIVAQPDDRIDTYAEVAAGKADVTLRDADTATSLASTYPSLSIGLPVSDLQFTGWAVAPGDAELAEAFQEFLAAAKADGSFGRLWLECFGMKLEDYYDLLRYRETSGLALTAAQSSRLEELKRSGGLRAAIDTELTVFEPSPGRETGGLHYLLLKRLERDLGIQVLVTPIRFDQFFAVNGEVPARAKTDPGYSYTPDLLKRCELYVGTLSPLPWRSKFLRFIPLYPSTLTYLVRPGVKIESAADLKGLRLSLLPNTTYESWLRQRELELGTRFTYVLVDTGRAAVEAIAAGRADATLSDANLALARMREFKGLGMAPASAEPDMISWAVAKKDEALASLIEAWLESIKADGGFESLWRSYYGGSFVEYLAIIGGGERGGSRP